MPEAWRMLAPVSLNVTPWRVLVPGIVLIAWATWLILAKIRGSQKQATVLPLVVEVEQRKCGFEEHTPDAATVGDNKEDKHALVSGIGLDEVKEEAASDGPQKEDSLPELPPVPFQDARKLRRASSESVGCFSGMFTKPSNRAKTGPLARTMSWKQ